MKTIIHNLKSVLWKCDMTTVEFAVATYSILSGLWFLNPLANTFRLANANVYEYIGQLMAEPVWGALLLGVGCVSMTVVFSEHLAIKKIVSMAGVFFWVWVSVMFASAFVWSWLFLNSVFLVIIYVWIHLRVARRSRVREQVKDEVREITRPSP